MADLFDAIVDESDAPAWRETVLPPTYDGGGQLRYRCRIVGSMLEVEREVRQGDRWEWTPVRHPTRRSAIGQAAGLIRLDGRRWVDARGQEVQP